MPATAKMGAMLTQGFDGQITMASASLIALYNARCGLCGFDSIEAETFDARLASSMDEIFLECKFAFIGFNDGSDWIIAHRVRQSDESPKLCKNHV